MTSRPLIGVTMRTADAREYAEERDAIALDWFAFAAAALPGVALVPLPNIGKGAARQASSLELEGVILSGGETPGASSRRDETDASLLKWAEAWEIPVIGVCRGAQVINAFCGGRLASCTETEHVAVRHAVRLDNGGAREVNSFHGRGIPVQGLGEGLIVRATTLDGRWVEAFAHASRPWRGVMWHPERETPANRDDIMLFRTLMGSTA